MASTPAPTVRGATSGTLSAAIPPPYIGDAIYEQPRSRLYTAIRDHIDEPVAEYVMSCLAPAPLSDLVTKDYLTAEFAKQRDALRAEWAAQREADRAEAAAQRDTDRAEWAAQRNADRAERAAGRAESTRQYRSLVGTFIALTGLLIATIFGTAAIL